MVRNFENRPPQAPFQRYNDVRPYIIQAGNPFNTNQQPARSYGNQFSRYSATQTAKSSAQIQPQARTGNQAFSTSSNNTLRQPASRIEGPLISTDEDWPSWVELGIFVYDLPPQTTTLELYREFSKEGAIGTIELFENTQGLKNGRGRIRFRPPPTKAFWRPRKFPCLIGKDVVTLRIELEPKRRNFLAPSTTDPTLRYPEKMVPHMHSVAFGLMSTPETMSIMRDTAQMGEVPVEFEIDLLHRKLDIRFSIKIADQRKWDSRALPPRDFNECNRLEEFRFVLPFADIRRIFEVKLDYPNRGFMISLEAPPTFYRHGTNIGITHSEGAKFWSDWETWYRQTDIVYDPRRLKKAPVNLKKSVQPIIDIGKWTTYLFKFNTTRVTKERYTKFCNALRDFNLEVTALNNFETTRGATSTVWQWIDKGLFIRPQLGLSSFLKDMEESSAISLSFPVRYQLEVCLSQGSLEEHSLSRAFVDRLASIGEQQALDLLQEVAEQKKRLYDPMDMFTMIPSRRYTSRQKIPSYCVHVRSANVTPSLIYYSTPSVEISNRVVRHYLEHSDRFLRVRFTDEKTRGRINPTDKPRDDEIFTRIKRTMTNGIVVGDRHFEFLAFGNSQFREHGAYFFAPTPHLNANDIRSWMGEFTSIKIVAKYAARLGQCFSTTRAITGTNVDVKKLDEIERNGYVFSDGVVKISPFLAQIISSELGLTGPPPSVFQFRLGGCKGVLAVCPGLPLREVHIRQSQYKFPAVHNGLEIIRWSQFAGASLNRQLITVLSALGVPDQVFKQKQTYMLTTLEEAMSNEKVAVSLLQKYVDPNQMTLTIAEILQNGFMTTKDPFVLSTLQFWRAWSIKYLKEKAKILIEDGAFVLGCIDETATLKGHFDDPKDDHAEDSLPEIFIQISDRERKNKKIVIEGICLLARNPSLHPGDIRVVKAVNVAALHHLHDVVVLPQTGDRDVASMCSGGDLDGDDYLVIWDPDLLPTEWNHEPMNYKAPDPLTVNRPVTVDDITSFFVTYMKNDRLPTIATSHMAVADLSVHGVKDERCLRLADLHSKAVDYVKTGQAARMPEELRPRQYPHFMEKTHLAKEKTYHSSRILGQLYDQVKREDFVPNFDAPFDVRVLNSYDLEDDILHAAEEIKHDYDAAVLRIMAQHGIKTEFEIWTTFVMQQSTSRDYKFHEQMGEITTSLKDWFRKACYDRAGSKDYEVLGPFVAAMYTVTQKQISQALRKYDQMSIPGLEEFTLRSKTTKSMPLISFPWLFPHVLCRIANGTIVKKYEITSGEQSGSTARRYGRKGVQPLNEEHQQDDTVHVDGRIKHIGDLIDLFDDAADDNIASTDMTSLTQSVPEGLLKKSDIPETSDTPDESFSEDGDEPEEVILDFGQMPSAMERLERILE